MRDLSVVQFQPGHAAQAAEIFLAGFHRLRSSVDVLPDTLADPAALARRIDRFLRQLPGVAALHRGRLVGYLGWTAVDGYAEAGYTRCSVDFESFNPQARSFWLRWFTPVCLSVVRYPEAEVAP